MKMRILIIVSNLLNPYLGPSTVAYNTLKGFIKIQKELEKYNLKIFFLSLNDKINIKIFNNIEIIGRTTYPPITFTGELQAMLGKPGCYFNIVHSHNIYELFPYITSSKIKTIFTLHGIFWKEIYFKHDIYSKLYLKFAEMRLRFYYRYIDKFVAISPYVVEEIKKKGFDIQKVVVIGNPVADEFFDIEKNEDNIILYPASIVPRKNQAGFLKAISIIKDEIKNYKIVFTGTGSSKYIRKLRMYAEKKGLNVVFLGRVPYTKLLHLYSKASVVVLTSFQETLPMSVLEALATGTPVITSNVGGLKYLVKDFYNGFLVDPSNPISIAEKLLLLLQDDGLRANLGKNAKKTAEDYRSEVIARKLLNLYLNVYNG